MLDAAEERDRLRVLLRRCRMRFDRREDLSAVECELIDAIDGIHHDGTPDTAPVPPSEAEQERDAALARAHSKGSSGGMGQRREGDRQGARHLTAHPTASNPKEG